MFKTAELGQKVSKGEFKQRELILREDLLALQQRLRSEGNFPVILDFAGVRGAGKGTSVKSQKYSMHVITRSILSPHRPT